MFLIAMKSLPLILIFSTIFFMQGCFCNYIVRNTREVAETYPTKYDNIDVGSILASERLLKNYMNCLLDKGPCSPDGQLLRREFLIYLSCSTIDFP